jgi:N-glycosylase/DNA lyase
MTSAGGIIRVHCIGKGRLTVPQRNSIRRVLRSCLRLDETLEPFHREMRRFPSYRWISSSRAGRLLRAPTAFEDVVKMLCTTNCTWALTTQMVRNLVHRLGAGSTNGTAAFPTPATIAETSERFLRNEIKAGYRAPYLLEFARRAASGDLDPESWRRSALPTEDLMAAVRSVKGIGPYAAENILRLLGRYEHLAFDSWVRRRYSTLFHKGRRVRDASIEARYAPFGSWKGLVFWLEMTRDWHEGKFPV